MKYKKQLKPLRFYDDWLLSLYIWLAEYWYDRGLYGIDLRQRYNAKAKTSLSKLKGGE